MSIHINELVVRKAVAMMRRTLERSQSLWLIWSVSDEGYKMALSSSREAANIRKYWPETIAGEFKHPAPYYVLLDALVAAKKNQLTHDDGRTDKRRAYEARYKAMRRAGKSA